MRKFCYTPGVCVHCNGENLSYSEPIIEDNNIIYNYECDECHTQGQEVYDIIFSINELRED